MDPNSESQVLSFQGEGQTPTPSEDQPTPGTDPKVGGTESADGSLFESPAAQAWLDKASEQILDKTYREVQRRVDSTINTQQKKVEAAVAGVEAMIKEAKKTGLEITPEAEQAMKDQAVRQARQSDGAGADPPAPSPGSSDTPPSVPEPVPGAQDLVANDIPTKQAELIRDIGAQFQVLTNDAEARMVKADGTPTEFITTLHAAMLAKRERLSGAAGIQSPGGASVTGGQSSGVRNNNNVGSLLSDGLKDLDNQGL